MLRREHILPFYWFKFGAVMSCHYVISLTDPDVSLPTYVYAFVVEFEIFLTMDKKLSFY